MGGHLRSNRRLIGRRLRVLEVARVLVRHNHIAKRLGFVRARAASFVFSPGGFLGHCVIRECLVIHNL